MQDLEPQGVQGPGGGVERERMGDGVAREAILGGEGMARIA